MVNVTDDKFVFNNISATTSSFIWPGGKGSFRARSASWGGGSASLEMLLPDQATWVAVGTDTTKTSDGGGNFELDPCELRVAIATATGVYAQVNRVPRR